ncbi:hypothetical protein F383_34903 [Gossypium arboreum]|uniref:Uncharacterized protein n=1 Tax=Gossypium arboreum TaxID=29729 RepID=A0A0B0PYT7_GOSAR|nr:hypothetical protein F383_34903 [Gossypium arboreum]
MSYTDTSRSRCMSRHVLHWLTSRGRRMCNTLNLGLEVLSLEYGSVRRLYIGI